MRNSYWQDQVVVAFLVVVTLLIAWPFSSIAFDDEWAFARTALDFARTGHLVYHGWTATPIGIQALWGALWIELFGFSYTVLHLSSIPFAAGCACLTYSLAIGMGAGRQYSLLAALTLALSPLFFPLAGTYMTDVPGAFFILLCQWAALRALTSEKPRPLYGWLALGLAACAAGGSIRQSAWIIGVPTLLYVGYRKLDRRILILSSLLTLSLACLSVLWFKRQSFAVSDDLVLSIAKAMRHPFSRLITLLILLAQLLLFALPCLICVLKAGWWRRIAVWVAPALLLVAMLALSSGKMFLLAPWTDGRGGNIVTRFGILAPDDVSLGEVSMILSPILRLAVTALVLAAFGALILSVLRRPLPATTNAQRHLNWFLLPAALYLPVLCLRVGFGGPFDRYLLPILPICLIFVITRPELAGAPKTPFFGWAAAALFGLYSVAITHDYFAISRLRYRAISRLIDAGVPQSRIMAGIDYDGWTQINVSGHTRNAALLQSQKNEEKLPETPVPEPFMPWHAERTPDIHPSYFVTISPRGGLRDARLFPPITTRTWLPPFEQPVFTQVPEHPLNYGDSHTGTSSR